jgi:SAM-dependent methyltransferase
MARLVPASARRLLDVGCSWGAFGNLLKVTRPRLQVFGIDTSSEASEIAKGRLDHMTLGMFPDDLPADWSNFDCITFNDSLEHFSNPWATLEACKPLLAPAGTIIASIPNVRWLPVSLGLLWKGTWRYEDTGILDRTHLRFFTRSGIEAVFTEAGYEIIYLSSWNRVITSRSARILNIFGHFVDDLLCMHFAVVARIS